MTTAGRRRYPSTLPLRASRCHCSSCLRRALVYLHVEDPNVLPDTSLSPALSPQDTSGFFLQNGRSARSTALSPSNLSRTPHFSLLIIALCPASDPERHFLSLLNRLHSKHGLPTHPTLRLRMCGRSCSTRIFGLGRICEKLCRPCSLHHRRSSHGRLLGVPRGPDHLHLRRGEIRCCRTPRPAFSQSLCAGEKCDTVRATART